MKFHWMMMKGIFFRYIIISKWASMCMCVLYSFVVKCMWMCWCFALCTHVEEHKRWGKKSNIYDNHDFNDKIFNSTECFWCSLMPPSPSVAFNYTTRTQQENTLWLRRINLRWDCHEMKWYRGKVEKSFIN